MDEYLPTYMPKDCGQIIDLYTGPQTGDIVERMTNEYMNMLKNKIQRTTDVYVEFFDKYSPEIRSIMQKFNSGHDFCTEGLQSRIYILAEKLENLTHDLLRSTDIEDRVTDYIVKRYGKNVVWAVDSPNEFFGWEPSCPHSPYYSDYDSEYDTE